MNPIKFINRIYTAGALGGAYHCAGESLKHYFHYSKQTSTLIELLSKMSSLKNLKWSTFLLATEAVKNAAYIVFFNGGVAGIETNLTRASTWATRCMALMTLSTYLNTNTDAEKATLKELKDELKGLEAQEKQTEENMEKLVKLIVIARKERSFYDHK